MGLRPSQARSMFAITSPATLVGAPTACFKANTRARVGASRRASVAVRADYDAGERRGRDTTFGMRQQMLEKKDKGADTSSFWGKVKAAFAIFFPPPRGDRAPRGEEASEDDPGGGQVRDERCRDVVDENAGRRGGVGLRGR